MLPQPYLRYQNPAALNVGSQGSWDLKNTEFLKSVEMISWCLVNFNSMKSTRG